MTMLMASRPRVSVKTTAASRGLLSLKRQCTATVPIMAQHVWRPYLSFDVLSCPLLSWPPLSWFVLSCLVLSCLVLSCLPNALHKRLGKAVLHRSALLGRLSVYTRGGIIQCRGWGRGKPLPEGGGEGVETSTLR